MNLQEGSLLRGLSHMRRYSARDVADLCQLYLISLHILRSEFEHAPWAQKYTARTVAYQNWNTHRLYETDLYQLLHMLLNDHTVWHDHMKNPTASKLFLQDVHMSSSQVRMFLNNLARPKWDATLSGRLLMQLERNLKIQVQNYRSMRRIASDWSEPHVDTEAKSLVITRLLQALRNRAYQGEILPELVKLAQSQKLEIHTACDPETGKNCDVDSTPTRPSLLKQIAVGAGLGLGAYMLGKALFGGKQS
jgi:hypothetical protein